MYQKICPSCKGDSYSATCRGQWICPYCEADMTCVEPHPAWKYPEQDGKRENGKVVNLHDYFQSNRKN